jgi:hypothetical protein
MSRTENWFDIYSSQNNVNIRLMLVLDKISGNPIMRRYGMVTRFHFGYTHRKDSIKGK